MPVFSFEKLRGAEISLGPEMNPPVSALVSQRTSTKHCTKHLSALAFSFRSHKQTDHGQSGLRTNRRAVGVAKRFEALGYTIYATRSTAKYLQDHGVNARRVNKISQESPNVMDLILGHKIDLVIDTPTQDVINPETDSSFVEMPLRQVFTA